MGNGLKRAFMAWLWKVDYLMGFLLGFLSVAADDPEFNAAILTCYLCCSGICLPACAGCWSALPSQCFRTSKHELPWTAA